jgi:hypothetical protein
MPSGHIWWKPIRTYMVWAHQSSNWGILNTHPWTNTMTNTCLVKTLKTQWEKMCRKSASLSFNAFAHCCLVKNLTWETSGKLIKEKEYKICLQDKLWPSGSYHFEFTKIRIKGEYSRDVLPLNLAEPSRYAKNAFYRNLLYSTMHTSRCNSCTSKLQWHASSRCD